MRTELASSLPLGLAPRAHSARSTPKLNSGPFIVTGFPLKLPQPYILGQPGSGDHHIAWFNIKPKWTQHPKAVFGICPFRGGIPFHRPARCSLDSGASPKSHPIEITLCSRSYCQHFRKFLPFAPVGPYSAGAITQHLAVAGLLASVFTTRYPHRFALVQLAVTIVPARNHAGQKSGMPQVAFVGTLQPCDVRSCHDSLISRRHR